MELTYLAFAISADEGGYAVIFPDVENAFTQGETLKEAKEMAEEALQMMLECRLEDGEDLPPISAYEDIKDAHEGIPIFVTATISSKKGRYNLTFDEKIMRQIDARTNNRTQFLEQAALEYMAKG